MMRAARSWLLDAVAGDDAFGMVTGVLLNQLPRYVV
jgi:hypothetical protein